MKRNVRRCDDRCHHAAGKNCQCWCGGTFHGAAGTENRYAIQGGKNMKLLKEHGFKKGKTAYINQTNMIFDQEGGAGDAGN